MGFLDNSGDIILDAVLTDTGRLRLAQGDGSFKISKFALGDDEINYTLYNKNHASGSAYYDLEVLQTPVLEAFTNNTSNQKTKLISVSRTNILYMPVLKLNRITNNNISGIGGDIQAGTSGFFSRPISGSVGGADGTISDSKFYVAVDQDTWNIVSKHRDNVNGTDNQVSDLAGVMQGYTVTDSQEDSRQIIRADQGLDTNEIAPSVGLDSDLVESAFIVEMDYRLGRVKGPKNHVAEAVNFIDDDNVAQYYLTSDTYINPEGNSAPANAKTLDGNQQKNLLVNANPQVFEGPRGKTLHFRVHASQDLQNSTYLFTQLGSSQAASTTGNILGLDATAGLLYNGQNASDLTIYYIDSIVRVVGANTGYRLDIPVRYVKIA
jgi:hypothetical protein